MGNPIAGAQQQPQQFQPQLPQSVTTVRTHQLYQRVRSADESCSHRISERPQSAKLRVRPSSSENRSSSAPLNLSPSMVFVEETEEDV